MVEFLILSTLCILICSFELVKKFIKKYRKHITISTLEYLQIFDMVRQQFEYKFRDSTLPPNMIDTMAHTRAIREAMQLHRNNKLVPYYKKLKAGRV